MHVKLLRSELRVDVSGFHAAGAAPEYIKGRRRPLGVIAANTLRTPPCPPPLCCLAKDTTALPDMWAIIKPGHVREKIAIFAPESRQTGSSMGDPPTVNHAPSLRAGKVKGSWGQSGDAKRRKRSAGKQNLQRDPGTLPGHRLPPCASTQTPAVGEMEGAEQKVSVGAIVAFLEECRASQHHAKLAIARTPSLEEPESVRVSDVVAKLEFLQRRSEGGAPTNLRRSAGRVLLAASPALTPLPPPSRLPSARDGGPTPIGWSRSPPSCGTAAPETPPSLDETEPRPGLLFLSAPSLPPPAIRSDESSKVSDDFLEQKRQLHELLKPPPNLAAPLLATLPQDVLVCVFALLPTCTLAALKCTCRYFKFIIEDYGVRPADSLWVSEPRYRDDPCKRCKRRYARGDVSLCRWHRKPYCQPLPYGPGFWMCCHSPCRDAPGCNVGLHDNRWVPAFDSISVPVCRRDADD
ncbi:F-box only protein 34 [Phyllopteryx taeniolatus]|uniref:F-box only protein 34 n=1 Tax=Phyllopteryx taeniolatus TaxID=161469 RepID=UPI002AD264A5|nr:F-box only protein 34 [Phyllopteryx taeniolatus]XP_061650379.1 F-box only protein 34 [Phyllopteryx taeniolatus]XP_061650380.1 F-box only protein 34 [Phyllopteryx taeniolatus]XP_061650381.1 F-box only protein 34 [Phyllopteryx taeniolatus]